MQDNYRKLLTYAYNIVGSYEDAKDLVQDVIEKFITLDKSNIRDESNFLIKSTINHSINFKNRHSKKEVFGEWLPEPVSFVNAETKLIKEQTAGYTMLVLLENLNPKERAVFILKEGFSYSHSEIAELLEISQDNSRQLLSRASKQLKNISYMPDNFSSTINSDVLKKYQKALNELISILSENLSPGNYSLNRSFLKLNDNGTQVKVSFLQDIEQSFDRVIACDGINSVVRNQVYPKIKKRYSGQTTWRGIATCELPYEFDETYYEMWGNNLRFGVCPLGNNKYYWYAVKVVPAGQKDDTESW